MRAVPLISVVALVAQIAFAAEEHVHAAGKSAVALKLNNDGTDYEAKGDFVNARKCYDEAIRIDSTMWPVYLNRATLDVKEHKLNQGLDDCTMAMRGNSAFNQSAVLRAHIYAKMGQYAIARSELDKLIALGGRGNAYDRALNTSAWLRATCPDSRFRNGQLAITEASRALNLPSTHKAEYRDTLAAAYAEFGDFDAAVRYQQQAIDLKRKEEPPKDKNAAAHTLEDSLQAYEARLELYKHHQPFRDPAQK